MVTVILPGIIVTLLSFAVFWTDTASVDPLAYGIGVIIVNLLSRIVLIEMLPICGELLWIDIFSLMNTAFCCVALFQSAFNIMCAYKGWSRTWLYRFFSLSSHLHRGVALPFH